jgi:hypothetical protein
VPVETEVAPHLLVPLAGDLEAPLLIGTGARVVGRVPGHGPDQAVHHERDEEERQGSEGESPRDVSQHQGRAAGSFFFHIERKPGLVL